HVRPRRLSHDAARNDHRNIHRYAQHLAGCVGRLDEGNFAHVSSLQAWRGETAGSSMAVGEPALLSMASGNPGQWAGATLPGRLRSPEATLNTLSTHRSGACR